MGRWRAIGLCAGAVLASLAVGAVALDRLYPPDLSRLRPSPVVEDRRGVMLRAFRAEDGQWRLPVEPNLVSPNYLRLLVAVEDRRFWSHPGVDPLALVRAAWQLVARGHVVSGGSTLTMQVVRLLEPRRRTFRAKLIEIARALQIEARMDKSEILRAYLMLTPMGGNLEGVRAGSLAWFGKEPRLLSDPEAALLVALPQSPRATRPDARPVRARRARDTILARALAAGVIDDTSAIAGRAAPLPSRRLPLPVLAPHLAERLVAEAPRPAAPIHTAIDARLQGDVERLLRGTVDGLPSPANLAAIVADWRTGEVLARVGSGDDRDTVRRGAIDLTRAVRSPGSTLKPFVYGMAFDGLLAHPASLIRDEPTRFDDYAPHNFDGGFDGDVTIRHALQASLNLPAVVVLKRLGPVVFADRFRAAGLPLVFADDQVVPSLPMVLGGTGLSLERLVTAYAALADGGTVKPLIERYGEGSAGDGLALMRRPAADAVVDILAGLPPPKGFASRAGHIAYKTGTSYRFRDGWALGFDGSRVIGVWMGRADGVTCRTCVGSASAAILFKLFDLLAPDPLQPRVLSPVFAGPAPAPLTRIGAVAASPRGGEAPRITFPLADARLLVDAAAPEVHLVVEGGQRPLHWIVDGRPIDSAPFSRAASWRPDEGFSTVTVVDALGLSDEIKVRIVRRDGGDESRSGR